MHLRTRPTFSELTSPLASGHEIGAHVERHGDGVRDLAIAVPEARVIGLAADARGEIAAAAPQLVDATGRADALLLGPGMGKSAASRRVLCKLLAAAKGAVVLDAGALDLAVVAASMVGATIGYLTAALAWRVLVARRWNRRLRRSSTPNPAE